MTPFVCPTCGQPTIPGKPFCAECGAALPRVCAACGQPLVPGKRFCADCGAPVTAARNALPVPTAPPALEAQFSAFQQALPPTLHAQIFTPEVGENRVLTILFVDLSGSVRAMLTLHPEDAATLLQGVLQNMVDAVLAHGGRINQVLGDAVLAFFGTPQAHENDPERAVRAAVQIRAAVQQRGANVTAGINTGEVYLGTVEQGPQHQVRAVGTAINLAARLQQKAQPGQILVGESVHRQLQRSFAFTRHHLELKGFAAPVPAYEVGDAFAHPEKVRGIEGLRAALIGRDAELAKLRDALELVRAGQGQMVSLIGEAGVGKSRLIAELKDRALAPAQEGPAPLWLEGRCLDVGMTASYWPFLDVLRTYFGWGPAADEPARAARLVSALQALVTQGDLAEDRMQEVGPLLGQVLAVRFGTAWDERLQHLSPEQLKQRTFLALRDLVLALARRQPLILVLEDLHWADTLSLDLIALLMEALTLAPLLLVCVYRPEREHKCWRLGAIAQRKCPERYTELPLRELTPPQSRYLVQALLRIADLPAAVTEAILQKARGNPFFVEEVVRSLIDAGLVYREGAVWRAREGIAGVAVPESIQSVVLSRIDRLDGEVKHVLQSAAVIGRLFRRRLVEQVAQKEADLDRVLWELEDRALVYQERAIPEEEYSFQHVLTQETVYYNILRRRRALFHRQVAEALEQLYGASLEEYYEQLAHHYGQAEAWPQALTYLMKAGDKAAAAYANDDALAFYAKALEACERLGDTALPVAIAAAQKQAEVHVRIKTWPAAAADYERMGQIARRLGDRRLEGLALAYRGGTEVQGHTLEIAEQTLQAALAIGEESYPAVRLAAHVGLTYHHVVTGRLAEAEVSLRVAEELAPHVQEPTLPDLSVPSDLRFWFHNWMGHFDEAIVAVDRAHDADTSLEQLAGQYWEEALARGGKGEYEQAMALLDKALAACERTGAPSDGLMNTMGWIYGELQCHEQAVAWNRRDLAAPREHNPDDLEGVNNARLNLGDGLAALGRLDEAEEQFQMVEETVRRPLPKDRYMLWRYAQHFFHSYGELWLTRGDAARALAYADECLQRAEETNSRKNIVKGRRLRGQALLAQGQLVEAEQELTRALELAQEVGNPTQLWKTQVALGDVRTAQGRADDVRAAYQAALATINRVASTLEDATLRETFLQSAHVQQVRQRAQ